MNEYGSTEAVEDMLARQGSTIKILQLELREDTSDLLIQASWKFQRDKQAALNL